MGKKNKITAVSLACLFPLSLLALVLLLPSVAIADTSTYDSPHKNTEGMECDHCHLLMLGTPFVGSPISVDDTTDNQLCLSCHNGLVAKFVSTHSSVAGGQNQWPETYPSGWTTACSDCHWGSGDSHGLHNQKNVTGSKLVEGTVTGATYDAASNLTTLTLSQSAGMTLDAKSSWARLRVPTSMHTPITVRSSPGRTPASRNRARQRVSTA